MATKKVIQMEKQTEQSTIVFDQTHMFGDFPVRFVIDLNKINSEILEYARRLKKHRKVKDEADLEFLSYEDNIVKLACENFLDIEDESERMALAIEDAKEHYLELMEIIRNEAFILAITVENDFSAVEISAYEDETPRRSLPGIGTPLPYPKRDIRFATEKRLAQIYKVLSADLQKWQGLRNQIIVEFSMVMKRYGESRLDGSTF